MLLWILGWALYVVGLVYAIWFWRADSAVQGHNVHRWLSVCTLTVPLVAPLCLLVSDKG